MKAKLLICTAAIAAALAGCTATETHQALQTEKAQQSIAINRSTSGVLVTVSVGQFANHSIFQSGVFASGSDRLGPQAQTILETSLQEAGCYRVLNRSNMNALKAESGYAGQAQKIMGARYVITGDVVEFGRKTTGDRQLWGILGHGKTQVAYAKVNISVVDVKTSAVVRSATGAGEYALSNRDVLGFGSTAGYDATLTGKVLSLAIREAVNDLTAAIDNGQWKPELQ